MRSVENNAGGTMVLRYTYAVNPITQRESVTTAGLAFGGTQANWRWDYDALGQVVRADNTTTNASDRSYAYDNIGNRLTSGAGVSLASLSSYTPNALNQYTQITTTSQPTVNPSFDADGNMSAGPVPGSAGNTPGIQAPANATEMKWDAENRLVFMKVGTQPVYFDYDYLSRLIARGITMPIRRHYCYDGWNRISEYIAGTVFNTFTWGTDLSGSMQGAGGVGGLLAMRWVDSSGNADYFPTYDGNGNVSEYLRTTGGIASHYEYDPFGRLTRLTGHTDTRFQYRFSTKPRDFDSGLYYYGYRWYDPLTGRWPSRDPIGEQGGVNLYGFVGNNGLGSIDKFGKESYKTSNEAVIAGAQKIFDLTRDKRLAGIAEFQGNFNENATWKLILESYNDIVWYNVTIYRPYRDGQVIPPSGGRFVGLVFGVEHSIAVFCCPENKEFQLSKETVGFFPSQNQYLDGTLGQVGKSDDSPCHGGVKIANIHSHNVGSAVVRDKGIEEFELASFIRSDTDVANKQVGVDHYVVGEIKDNIMVLSSY